MFPDVSDLAVAIDAWMAGMYHRRPMLDPQLERIGVGYARLPDGMLMAALRFEKATLRRGSWPERSEKSRAWCPFRRAQGYWLWA
jgi:hypothetical protein